MNAADDDNATMMMMIIIIIMWLNDRIFHFDREIMMNGVDSNGIFSEEKFRGRNFFSVVIA